MSASDVQELLRQGPEGVTIADAPVSVLEGEVVASPDVFVAASAAGQEAVSSMVGSVPESTPTPGAAVDEDDERTHDSRVGSGRRAVRRTALKLAGVSAAAIGAAGAVSVAIIPEAFASGKAKPTPSASAANNNSKCIKYEEIMSPSQVAQAIRRPIGNTGQSIVGAALSAVTHAGPSAEVHVAHPSSGTGNEVDAYYRARLANSDTLGTYVFRVGYSGGRLAAKYVNAINLDVIPGTFSGVYSQSQAQYLTDRYGFRMLSGDYANEGPKGRNWSVTVGYGQKKGAAGLFSLSSTLGNGNILGKPYLRLSPTSLKSVGTQFINEVKSAEGRKTINYQHILTALQAERTCP